VLVWRGADASGLLSVDGISCVSMAPVDNGLVGARTVALWGVADGHPAVVFSSSKHAIVDLRADSPDLLSGVFGQTNGASPGLTSTALAARNR